MEKTEHAKKCVFVIDADLPVGLIANTAAVLAVSIGRNIEDLLGPDVFDASGQRHLGITTKPLPILRGTNDKLKDIRAKAVSEELSDLRVVDFSNVAQRSKDYTAYTEEISSANADELRYLGIALYGDSKIINKLTGSLPLLRF